MFVLSPVYSQVIYDSPPVGVSLTRPILPWLARYFVGAGKSNVFLDSPQPGQTITGAAVDSTTPFNLPTAQAFEAPSYGGANSQKTPSWTPPKSSNVDTSSENVKEETEATLTTRKPTHKSIDKDDETTTKIANDEPTSKARHHGTTKLATKSATKSTSIQKPKIKTEVQKKGATVVKTTKSKSKAKAKKEEEPPPEEVPEEPKANDEATTDAPEESTDNEAPKEEDKNEEEAKSNDDDTKKEEDNNTPPAASESPPVAPNPSTQVTPFLFYEGPGMPASSAVQPVKNPPAVAVNYAPLPMANIFPTQMNYMYPAYAIPQPALLPVPTIGMPMPPMPPMPDPKPVFDASVSAFPPMPSPQPISLLNPTLVTPESPMPEPLPIAPAPQRVVVPSVSLPAITPAFAPPLPLGGNVAAAPGVLPAHAAIPAGSFIANAGVASPRYYYRNLPSVAPADVRTQRVYLQPSHKPLTKTK
ncbi:hypothetical protein M3Y98_00161200 [Aphelenchoides besseyi]|nr:hypothetical protein M3Y98_00161200 [Aphelenchoides besseyi]KAI6199910.1 hypothetical protein M3Y96_00677500 [Aphelenchoides besseyi]